MSNARPQDDAKRSEAARNRALWELGSASWADVILHAYWHPDEDSEDLAEEKLDEG